MASRGDHPEPEQQLALLAEVSGLLQDLGIDHWLGGGWAVDISGQLNTAVSLAVEDGRITRIYAVRNPHKLARLDGIAPLTRS